ncbi:cell division cycle 20.4, cofactor of APC complex-like isoform X2 [Frieseomelitta varia]|uniref:cell division cycle 20.4, cofactor of APC complex-like isoform X2 n=1 Tax=Frieseomelitta varia TaxID=561572 RepID=UPI001CB6AA12|nr:cell division cycle 20.4, cofactor of APC complex-like isoform X2 [Frieseomelitta varia]
MDKDSRLFKMRRMLLDSRRSHNQDSENIDTTPLRRSSVNFPRVRLLEKDFKSEDGPKPIVTNSQPIAAELTTKVIKTYPFKILNQNYTVDRFINFNYNKEAANYLLTKQSKDKLNENEIDVLKQVKSLSTEWRKKLMHQLMVDRDIIPGLRQKQVLRGNRLPRENKIPGSLAGLPRDLWDDLEDGMWKSKPRKRPLIGTMNCMLDMPGYDALPYSYSYKELTDWGSKNFIATAVKNCVAFYDTNKSDVYQSPNNVDVSDVCAIKWNNAGNKLVICTLMLKVQLYCIDTQKMIWTVTGSNIVRCICWSENDQHIVVGTKGEILVYSARDGKVVHLFQIQSATVVALAFSSNYRYLASSALDKNIRIFNWTNFSPHLDIIYYESVTSLAWQPYENGVLCIGGGVGDASLSLWNMNKLNPPTYRDVKFNGAVENMLWNKHSGELVVHWSYLKGRKQRTVMPVFASLDRIVDVLPVDKEMQVNAVMWNSDHTQLGQAVARARVPSVRARQTQQSTPDYGPL